MKVFGIKFAPLNVSLERRLQTVAASSWFVVMICGLWLGHALSMYLVLFTSWRWSTTLYLIWMYTIDRKTSERGGRPSQWVRNWIWWKYLKNYFPVKIEVMPFVQLDPSKNYIFCCFPHGLIGITYICGITTNACGFSELFPRHTPYTISLKHLYKLPFIRELILALGVCDNSSNSIDYLLRKPEGGNVVTMTPGGAAEAFHSRPGHYKLILKNRKGFVKLALKNGAPLVPVIGFGEPDVFDQVVIPKGSLLRTAQEAIKKWTGIAPIILIGRGFFQYTFGVIPRRMPLTMLVGRPIDVEKIEEPTQQQIDDLHSTFVNKLTELFEEEKHRYIENAGNVRLEIE